MAREITCESPETAYALTQVIVRSSTTGLNHAEKLLLAALASHANRNVDGQWYCYISNSLMASYLESEERTIKRHLRTLQRHGFIRKLPWHQATMRRKKHTRNDEIWIIYPIPTKGDNTDTHQQPTKGDNTDTHQQPTKGDNTDTHQQPTKGDKTCHLRVSNPVNKGDKTCHLRVSDLSPKETKKETINETIEETNTPARSCGEVVSDSFLEFWENYPRKVSKAKAQKAWSKYIKSPELAQRIIEHVKGRAAKDPQWLKDDGRYIPHPTTFLNGKLWEDEYANETLRSVPRGVTTPGERRNAEMQQRTDDPYCKPDQRLAELVAAGESEDEGGAE